MSDNRSIQSLKESLACHLEMCLHRVTNTANDIHLRNHPQSRAISEPIRHEFNTPTVISSRCLRANSTRQGCPLLLASLECQFQTCLLVKLIAPCIIDFTCLPLKQNLDATVTVAYSGGSEVSDSNPQSGMVFGFDITYNHRLTDSNNSAGSSLANFKADLQVTDKVLPDGRLQSFFAITSRSIGLIRVSSDTKFDPFATLKTDPLVA
jgi:hypothetical protein